MPKISVIMSVYNGTKYLHEAIDSILKQTFTDFEFIIINDGSTDATVDILNSYSDPRIKIITNPHNIGLTKSLNKALNIAQGEYIARLDADDIALSERLQIQVNYLDNHPDVTLLGSDAIIINELGDPIKTTHLPIDEKHIKYFLFFNNPFLHSTLMIRHTSLKEIGDYNENYLYVQDFELISRLAIKKHRLINLTDPLIKLRQHPNSITADKIKNKRQYELRDYIAATNISAYLNLTESYKNKLTTIIPSETLKTYKDYKFLINLHTKLYKTFINKEHPSPKIKKILKKITATQYSLWRRRYFKSLIPKKVYLLIRYLLG